MRALFLLLFCLCIRMACAQTEQSLIAEAGRQEVVLNETAALERLIHVLQVNPQNYFALWKASELCSRIGNRQPTRNEKIAYFSKGRQYAEQAIKVNPQQADGYYALSVALGKQAMLLPVKEKVQTAKAIRSNAEKAIALNPQHGRAWHVLGKWHYEVHNLNMMEKAAVKMIFGGLPAASIEQSIKAYEKARVLEPDFALNYLELAKAYIKNNQKKQAVLLLKKLPSMTDKTADDQRIKAEGKALLNQLLH